MTGYQTLILIISGAVCAGVLVEINKKLGAIVVLLAHIAKVNDEED